MSHPDKPYRSEEISPIVSFIWKGRPAFLLDRLWGLLVIHRTILPGQPAVPPDSWIPRYPCNLQNDPGQTASPTDPSRLERLHEALLRHQGCLPWKSHAHHWKGERAPAQCPKMITSLSKVEPKLEAYAELPARLGTVLPPHLQQESIYRWAHCRLPKSKILT